jgi:tRNA A-37 threonylcarbamoyl transferase component Bud32
MIKCPTCSADIAEDSRFCKSCGQPISSPSQMPTMEAPVAESPRLAETPHVARIISSDSIPAGGFTPGTILAERYRIIGLLGRGGMGEVYRADDLKLGQPVALKFLPRRLAQDPVRRERFFAEVRITRQLSHPNICRVYDISETEGLYFLSMEFIDGEDLASLLKRIGHLSNEKALDIARQLAAGLAAAHEHGVLHRDLKPANIMLDGHGRVRITDFGLAVAIDNQSQTVEIAGTPAYMAPEQLAGRGATVRSDIYSLGLVLYEIHTGKKAFTASTLAELREQKETYTPRAPSELREGVDQVVERLIRRCMERDPNARPSSVAQLAMALPGGDPLAAALAAGETPSPEMVAESGGKEGIRPAMAWSLVSIIIVGIVAVMAINDRIMLYRRIPFAIPPQALVENAREVIWKAGYAEKYVDSAYGFVRNTVKDDQISEKSGQTEDQWNRLDANAFLFWYRQSPHSLDAPVMNLVDGGGAGVVTFNNPPMQFSGEILVFLNTEGRLVSLRAMPPQGTASPGNAALTRDWTGLLAEAGMDPLQWSQDNPQWNPQSFADSRAAWKSSNPQWTGVRIEAAAYQGKAVGFKFLGPTSRVVRAESDSAQRPLKLGVLLEILTIVGLFFARRNLRLGRGDRRSAIRLAVFTGASFLLLSILMGHLNVNGYGALLLFELAAFSLSVGFICWILYMALEPFARRRWPQVLVSWTRLISGDWRDPLVARDILIGVASGLSMTIIFQLGTQLIPSWFGRSVAPPEFDGRVLLGMRFALVAFVSSTVLGAFISVVEFSALFLFRVLLKRQIIAIIGFVLLWTVVFGETTPWSIATQVAMNVVFAFILMRFGFMAFAFSIAAFELCFKFPLTLDTSAYYSGYGYAILAVLAAIIFVAFRKSLGGRSMIAAAHLDD